MIGGMALKVIKAGKTWSIKRKLNCGSNAPADDLLVAYLEPLGLDIELI